ASWASFPSFMRILPRFGTFAKRRGPDSPASTFQVISRSKPPMDRSASKTRRVSIAECLLIAAAGLPFLASLGYCSMGRTQHPLSTTIDRPGLVFDQYLVNLGEIHNELRPEGRFRFKNCGTVPIRITKVTPSCSCLAPRIEKRAYAPGEISDFTLGV